MDYLYYLQRVSTGECSDNSKAIKKLDQDNISICTHMESLAEDLKAFKLERDEMKSTLLDLRCRSMKNNLVFTGLGETQMGKRKLN